MGWWHFLTDNSYTMHLLGGGGGDTASNSTASAGGVAHSVFDPDYVENYMNPLHALVCLTGVIIVANILEVGMHWLEHRFSEWPHYARLLNKGEEARTSRFLSQQ